ncbi:hypothetical protein [Azospirillum argentinense]|uniref:hypothetical protein n=1 Tax=Azospirillum argentinense TaxID=2970906 RepID=UPI0032DF38B1
MSFQLTKAKAKREAAAGDQRTDKMVEAVVDLVERADYVREITSLWENAQHKFLLIGRYLNMAKERLDHGEFLLMIERDLPFTRNIAFQMRSVAHAIDGGRFSEDELPPAYSVAYQIVSLKDDEVDQARARQLIRPDVKRDEVLAFKRDIRPVAAAKAKNEKALRAERERLVARLAEIDRLLGN